MRIDALAAAGVVDAVLYGIAIFPRTGAKKNGRNSEKSRRLILGIRPLGFVDRQSLSITA